MDEIKLAPGYDWRKSLGAALKDLAHSLVGVVSAAAIVYLSDPASLSGLLAAVPVQYALPAGLAASALTAYARNYLKNVSKG